MDCPSSATGLHQLAIIMQSSCVNGPIPGSCLGSALTCRKHRPLRTVNPTKAPTVQASTTHAGPVRMLVIHHKSVRMAHPTAAGGRALGVRMSGRQVRVLVLDHLRVLRRPDL